MLIIQILTFSFCLQIQNDMKNYNGYRKPGKERTVVQLTREVWDVLLEDISIYHPHTTV